jgi:hypothetical protein
MTEQEAYDYIHGLTEDNPVKKRFNEYLDAFKKYRTMCTFGPRFSNTVVGKAIQHALREDK